MVDSAWLRQRMEDPSHPVTKMLTDIYALRERHVFDTASSDSFASILVDAFRASQSEAHYKAMYALWDDAPFKDVSRMVMRVMHKYIVSSYEGGGYN